MGKMGNSGKNGQKKQQADEDLIHNFHGHNRPTKKRNRLSSALVRTPSYGGSENHGWPWLAWLVIVVPGRGDMKKPGGWSTKRNAPPTHKPILLWPSEAVTPSTSSSFRTIISSHAALNSFLSSGVFSAAVPRNFSSLKASAMVRTRAAEAFGGAPHAIGGVRISSGEDRVKRRGGVQILSGNTQAQNLDTRSYRIHRAQWPKERMGKPIHPRPKPNPRGAPHQTDTTDRKRHIGPGGFCFSSTVTNLCTIGLLVGVSIVICAAARDSLREPRGGGVTQASSESLATTMSAVRRSGILRPPVRWGGQAMWQRIL